MTEDALKRLLPFAFPPENQETPVEPPPEHPELADFGFADLYGFIFRMMNPNEKIFDSLKRHFKAGENIDELAAWISELYMRGELDVLEKTWPLTALNGGMLDELLSSKWIVKTAKKTYDPATPEEIGPKHKVYVAKDAQMCREGTEEWYPVAEIDFSIFG